MPLLAIDIGGTKVALRSTGGPVRYDDVVRWPTSASLDEDLSLLRAAVAGALDATGTPAGAGIAFPATVDPSGTVTSWPNRPSWVGLDWTGLLAELFPGTRVRTADDGDLAALAEAHHAGCADALYFGVGTGVGGGAVLDGRLVPGARRGSCEIGHLVIATGAGPRCGCGRRGCLQSIASGPAMLRRAGELRGEPVEFDDLRAAWLDGQPWARRTVHDGCAALAAAAVGVSELLHPDVVLVGGGFAAGMPGFTESVADQVAALARPGHPTPPVAAATLGARSSLMGALLLAEQDG
ncbi:ROK family protein [Saccharopolyspora sp. NPDC002578]